MLRIFTMLLLLLNYFCLRVLQEYFIRHKTDSSALRTESQREQLTLCIIAAIERRISHVCSTKPPIV